MAKPTARPNAGDGGAGRETIFALASGAGNAAIAIIRISGPDTRTALERLAGKIPPPRHATLMRLRGPGEGETIDHAVALLFPGPASYSGEDMAELHIHGGVATIRAVTAALASLDGLRPAEPGEFTRRAFDNGKLDLTEIEGLADLIAAETEAQRRQALAQMEGRLGALYEGWRATILRALAHAEAAIDFPEDGLPPGLTSEALPAVKSLIYKINQHINDDSKGQTLRRGVVIALVGPPNAGKSTLLNILARREAAIVSATAGTTRDVIEVHIDLDGLPAIVADTAGLRAQGIDDRIDDPIEAEGMRRARARADNADIRILLADASDPAPAERLAAQWPVGDTIAVLNKIDLLAPETGAPPPEPAALAGLPALPVSLRTGAGLARLLEVLGVRVREKTGDGNALYLTRARHRLALVEAAAALTRALEGAAAGADPELVAEDLRLAARAIGRITGRVDVEDLLDIVFREFCIGK